MGLGGTRRRRSVRLRAHDYREGLYFVTICTHGRQRLFGEVMDGRMVLSDAGQIAHDEWLRTEAVRPDVVLDAFVVMPDHVHVLFGIVPNPEDPTNHPSSQVGCRGVLQYAPTGGHRGFESPSQSVGAIIRGCKGAVTNAVNRHRQTRGGSVWQRGFHDRVVRTDREAEAVRLYIAENPPPHWDYAAARADGHRA